VHATTVNRTDCGFRSAKPFFTRLFTGLRRPKHRTLGSEFAGVIEQVGSAVTEFAVGDRVFGVNMQTFGAHADLMCMRASGAITTMPEGMAFDEAAPVGDGGTIALACLGQCGVQAGQRILIYGASGAIGTAAVQLARHLGAHVTAVCNTKNLELVRSLGADEVIDYTVDDFTQNGQRYDVVLDAVGKHSYRRCRRSIVRGGTFATTDLGFGWHVPPLTLITRVIGAHRVRLPIPTYDKANLLALKHLVEAGEFRPVIDRRYPFADVVEATRYVETQQKTGNVVLLVAPR
jgi:NADPH:quinone reductase-like Zn-dependent oxidoreductase